MKSDVLKSEELSSLGKSRTQRGLFDAFLDAARLNGPNTEIVVDGDGRKLSYSDLRRASFALGLPLKRLSKDNDNIGILLPTGAGAAISFLAIHAAGRTPAMLNFTSGIRNLKDAVATGPIPIVLTAHKFVEIADMSDLICELSSVAKVVYLEDLQRELSIFSKLSAVFGPIFPFIFSPKPSPDDKAVVLFTSGTEGNPKGVVLSHSNVLANIEQIEQHVELEATDIFFNPLPTFHCYGLTAGTLWPIFSGRKVVLHPSPLQIKTIAQRIASTKSTILFATDTFLNQYMRSSADGGLASLRITVGGAEKVREETRKVAGEKFDMQVLEGYGVTECAPVLAANQPGDIHSGTIGKMLPGIEAWLEPVEGLEGAGKLWVRGPNIMKGYITSTNPGIVKPLVDGWYDTGDIVSINEDGHYVIRGRLKRFAKIGGEMVSLTVVENCASAVWPEFMHAAAILPDLRKGEQIVLVTDNPKAKRSELLRWAQAHGVPELSVPKKIISAQSIPILGTGKLDYKAITQLAQDSVIS